MAAAAWPAIAPARRGGTPRRRRSAPLEAADAERPCLARPALLGLPHVPGRVLVHRRDAGEVARLEGDEGDGKLVPALQAGQAAEVGQRLALLLGHVVAVGLVRRGDRGEPAVAADQMPAHLRHRVPYLVVVADGVHGLLLDAG